MSLSTGRPAKSTAITAAARQSAPATRKKAGAATPRRPSGAARPALTRSTHPSYTRCRRANACGARRSTIAPTGPQARIMKGVVKVVTAETATATEKRNVVGGASLDSDAGDDERELANLGEAEPGLHGERRRRPRQHRAQRDADGLADNQHADQERERMPMRGDELRVDHHPDRDEEHRGENVAQRRGPALRDARPRPTPPPASRPGRRPMRPSSRRARPPSRSRSKSRRSRRPSSRRCPIRATNRTSGGISRIPPPTITSRNIRSASRSIRAPRRSAPRRRRAASAPPA